MKSVTIEIPDGKSAEWVNGVLTLVDEQSKDITERIKTFEDACKWCGENGKKILNKQYMDGLKIYDNESSDLLAYLKLRIITAALNEGWEPEFKEDEYRWYPWFYLYTKEDYEKMADEEKNRCGGRSNYSAYAYGGLVCAIASNASSNSSTSNGSRLTFREKRLAEYAGTQFAQLYADFIFAKN